MKSLYNGQENHYKKMLDLQEKLRRSEEERIRLEEKFSLLVQESRNRHRSCINQLRIRYVEFLEEQRIRDERNNKLLGTLDKVDNSLASMSAKTERLSILRKQYEAYLLRAYGSQRANESVAADSGLESQNDREISPTPVFSKSIAFMRKNSMSYASPECPPLTHKIPMLELSGSYELSAIEKSTNIQRDLNDKFAQAAAVPSFYDEVKDVLRSRLHIPSYLAETSRYSSSSTPKPKPAKIEIGTSRLYAFDPPKYTSTPNIESGSRSLPARSRTSTAVEKSCTFLASGTPGKYDLERYLSKIKQAQADALEDSGPEPEPDERSLEDVEQEQNTSGDLLNVTLSDDGNPIAAVRSCSPEEDAASAKNARSRFRALLMRQAYAAENGSRNRPIDRPIDRTRRTPISKLSKLREGDAEQVLSANDKLRQSEIGTLQPSQQQQQQREIGRPFARPPPLSVDDAFAKLALLSEPRRPNLQKQALPVIEDVLQVGSKEKEKEEEEEARLLAETAKEDLDQESKNDEDQEVGAEIENGNGNGNGSGSGDGIEDDYDETVDIDTWMPDDAVQQLEEVAQAHDDIRAIPRRKLESIEEVEQLDDEEDPNNDEAKPHEEIILSDVGSPSVDESPMKNQQPDQLRSTENANDAPPRESKEQPCNEQYTGYDGQYEENAENYEQQQHQQQQEQEQEQQYQGGEQQQYQYSAEQPCNQQYGYDANAPYTGYDDSQQYTEAQYEEYMKQYQQYDPNQVYEHDLNQQYQQYEGYQVDGSATQALQYQTNQVYDYSQQDLQDYGESYLQEVNQAYDYSAAAHAIQQSGELCEAADRPQELTGEQSGHSNLDDESSVNDKPKENKKKKDKKDVIKSILDSDSESIIERNLSNTESDFDFN